MKKNIIRIMVAAGVLSLTCCINDDGLRTDFDAGSITIQASIGQMTKVEYMGNASKFMPQDTIAVYGWTGRADSVPDVPEVDGVRYGLGTDGKWIPESNALWKTDTTSYYFLGIYPERDVTNFTADDYMLDTANYAASDLLVATNLGGVKATDGAVKLTFNHVMAKLNLNLKFRNEFGDTAVVSSVTVTAKSGATIDYMSGGQVTATGSATAVSIPAAASAATGYVLGYSGLMVPQDGVRKITVTIGGNSYMYEATSDIPLHSGKYTTLGLFVGGDKIELSTISIADWENEAPQPDVEAVYDPYNGHAYVDLGLPSGLKWATCNVGADNPWDYGDYFAWGDTVPQDIYSWSTYKWGEGSHNNMTKYCDENSHGKNGFTDNKTVLDLEDDVANVKWGSNWRMPTSAECEELLNNCDWVWKTAADGYAHNGWLFTSKINGNSIFFPAAGMRDGTGLDYAGSGGHYWSSSLCTYDDFPAFARCIWFQSNAVKIKDYSRYAGHSVRPVFGTTAPVLGDLYYSDGTWSAELIEGKTPIGVIAYLDQLGTDDDEITESGNGGGHGLVLCLKNAASDVCWSTEDAYEFGESAKVDNFDSLKRSINVSGYTNTLTLAAKDGAETKYPAAWQARNYTGLPAPAGTTGWFLPSAQQWLKMLEGLGGLAEKDIRWGSFFDFNLTAAHKWNEAMKKAGTSGTDYDSMTDNYQWFWSSSEYSASLAIRLIVNDGSGFHWFWTGKDDPDDLLVRPVLAF